MREGGAAVCRDKVARYRHCRHTVMAWMHQGRKREGADAYREAGASAVWSHIVAAAPVLVPHCDVVDTPRRHNVMETEGQSG